MRIHAQEATRLLAKLSEAEVVDTALEVKGVTQILDHFHFHL